MNAYDIEQRRSALLVQYMYICLGQLLNHKKQKRKVEFSTERKWICLKKFSILVKEFVTKWLKFQLEFKMCRAGPFCLLSSLIVIQISSLHGLRSSKENLNFLKLNENEVVHRVQVNIITTLNDSEVVPIETNVLPESEVLKHLPIADFSQIFENYTNSEKTENAKRNVKRSSSIKFVLLHESLFWKKKNAKKFFLCFIKKWQD